MNKLKAGTKLHDSNYTIIKVLGQGGFGITYLAHDELLDRDVAIKEFFLKDLCARDEDTNNVTPLGTINADLVRKLKNRFLKEARRIAGLKDLGIIKIFSAFEENGTAYYVMEYIDGESLSQKVKNNGALESDAALEYVKAVAKSLLYLHSKKIAHLDVKPANIMIRKGDDTPILIDFGISKQYDATGEATSTDVTGVSHGFAPLEQYAGKELTAFSPASDIYSLAATLFYLLTGNIPPRAPELATTRLDFPDSMPGNFKTAISKAMAVKREDRQSSVDEFIDALENADESTEIIEQPPKSTVAQSQIEEPQMPINIDREPPEQSDPLPPPEAPKSNNNFWKTAFFIVVIIAGGIGIYKYNIADERVINPQDSIITSPTETTSEIGANGEDTTTPPPPPPPIKKTKIEWISTNQFKGNVGPYPVNMTINGYGACDNTVELDGSYTYTQYGNTLRLEGVLNCKTNQIEFDEYTPKGKKSGHWYLTVGKDNSLKGTFINHNNEHFTVNLNWN